MELFVELDELDETLLKKDVSFIRQRIESAEEDAVDMELRLTSLQLTIKRRLTLTVIMSLNNNLL